MVTVSVENISALKEIAPSCNKAITILLEEKRLADTMESADEVKGTLKNIEWLKTRPIWKKNKNTTKKK